MFGHVLSGLDVLKKMEVSGHFEPLTSKPLDFFDKVQKLGVVISLSIKSVTFALTFTFQKYGSKGGQPTEKIVISGCGELS